MFTFAHSVDFEGEYQHAQYGPIFVMKDILSSSHHGIDTTYQCYTHEHVPDVDRSQHLCSNQLTISTQTYLPSILLFLFVDLMNLNED